MTLFMSVIRRFHGTRCIISNMNNGRDMNPIKHIIQEANRQKLELRIVELERAVKQLNEKVKILERIQHRKVNMVPDCKCAN